MTGEKVLASNTAVAGFTLREPIDVVLKGGGAKGAAHIGAIDALKQLFTIRTYAGTSAGALAATLFACGFEPSEVQELTASPFKMIRGGDDDRGIDADDLIRATRGAMFHTDGLEKWLRVAFYGKFGKAAGRHENHDWTFGELASVAAPDVNLMIFASDVKGGLRPFGFVHGSDGVTFVGQSEHSSVVTAVAASVAIPFVFEAPHGFGTRFVDGGLFANFPLEQTAHELSVRGVAPHIVGIGLEERVDPHTRGFEATVSDILSAVTDARDAAGVQRFGAEDRLVIIGTGPFSTVDFHLTRDDQALLIEHARTRVASVMFRRLARTAGGVANLPRKAPLRVYTGDETTSWDDFQKKVTERENANEHNLNGSDIGARRPDYKQLAITAALRMSAKSIPSPALVVGGLVIGAVIAVAAMMIVDPPFDLEGTTTDAGAATDAGIVGRISRPPSEPAEPELVIEPIIPGIVEWTQEHCGDGSTSEHRCQTLRGVLRETGAVADGGCPNVLEVLQRAEIATVCGEGSLAAESDIERARPSILTAGAIVIAANDDDAARVAYLGAERDGTISRRPACTADQRVTYIACRRSPAGAGE